MSHNVQKDWELLAVVGDGNLKKNRNTENVNEQEAPQGAGIEGERERDKNL